MMKFAVTLSTEGRDATGRQTLLDYFAAHGAQPTGGGFVTLSFVVSDDDFTALFGPDPDPAEARPRDAEAVGGGAPMHETPIRIPDVIAPLVEHVSVTPQARHFTDDP